MKNISNVKKLSRAGMLLAFALVIIFTGSRLGGTTFNSFVVGPLVNAVLITTVLLADLKFGILAGILTPILAALTGQLLAPMVPFIPFIMLGNVTYVLVFGLSFRYIEKYGIYAGIAAGALLKMLVMVISVKYLVTLFKVNIPAPVLKKLAVVMSYPQLYTAIAGGILAMILYSIFKRAYGRGLQV